MLAQFQAHYPTANLISELLQIYQGKFVVRVEVQVDGVTRATGLACAENPELAEDRARSRALMILLPEPSSGAQPEMSPLYPTVIGEAQPVVKPSLPSDRVDKKQPSSFATTSELEQLKLFGFFTSANAKGIGFNSSRATFAHSR